MFYPPTRVFLKWGKKRRLAVIVLLSRSFGTKLSFGGMKNETDILYGYKPDSSKFYALNHVLLIAKHHIFQAWLQDTAPNFNIFLSVLKDKTL